MVVLTTTTASGKQAKQLRGIHPAGGELTLLRLDHFVWTTSSGPLRLDHFVWTTSSERLLLHWGVDFGEEEENSLAQIAQASEDLAPGQPPDLIAEDGEETGIHGARAHVSVFEHLEAPQ
ncbi:hypothetical protein JOQ06_004129, partial [Pogonophryne albipinna]